MACEYCGRIFGHSARCPNYIDNHAIGKCKDCGEPIGSCEEYIETYNGELFHVDCLSSMPIHELLYHLDVDIKTVDPYDAYE